MAKKKRTGVGQYITGKVLSNDAFIRRLPVLGYFGFLLLLYMANSFSIQSKYEYLDRLSDQIKTLRTVSATASEKRMAMSQEKEVIKQIEKFNINIQKNSDLPRIIE